ncbi:hypothetical protein FCV44_20110 [Vibrio kanaloae]|uniref:transposase n=1 Tax=Vibrio kanaloae TaxID=170673 RepID=UPI0010BEE418|nr:hypothetical protein FCV44_20110 [Vibrio kanaloae]TKF18290.1 hypothetical protein FCV47_06475 [Vibrio kanaloae]
MYSGLIILDTLIVDNTITNRGEYKYITSIANYTKAFKEEAVGLITEQSYSVAQAANALGVTQNLLYTWKQNTDELDISLVDPDENTELLALKKEVKSKFLREHRSRFPTKMGFVA